MAGRTDQRGRADRSLLRATLRRTCSVAAKADGRSRRPTARSLSQSGARPATRTVFQRLLLTMTLTNRSKAAKPTGRSWQRSLAAFVAALGVMPVAASTRAAEVDEAFRHRNWTQIERHSVRWALEIHPDVETVQAVAAAGLTGEALAAARTAPVVQRPSLLLAAASGSDLPVQRRLEIVQAAFRAAQDDAMPSVSKAADLGNTAVAFARLGEDASARLAFDAATASANKSSGTSAYGVLIDALLLAAGANGAPPIWMLDGVAARADIGPGSDKVRVHRSLARGYFQVRQVAKAMAQLELALASVKDSSAAGDKRVAVQALARMALRYDAVDFARRHGELGELGGELAAYYARRNERAQALAEVARLGPGSLYVSHRSAAAMTIIGEAIDRRSVDAAVAYCTALCQLIGREEIRVRARLGRLQAQAGQHEGARANFLRARELLPLDPSMDARDVQATLDLAVAAQASGMHALAKETVAAAVQQTGYVSLTRRQSERPLVEARTSHALSELNDRTAATEMLLRAWSAVKALSEDAYGERSEKAKALLAIAKAARVLRSGMPRRASER